MPRRELLTAAQREALPAFPEEEENLEWFRYARGAWQGYPPEPCLASRPAGAQTPANDLLAESAPLLRSVLPGLTMQ